MILLDPPMSEVEEQVDQTSQNNLLTTKQGFIDETESAINIPESPKTDTSYPLQWQAVSNSTSHQGIDLDANLQDDQLQDKEEQGELFKETPVKSEDNKPYIDNIDTYNRDRALITQSLGDRLGLGQNSLPGAQQVRVATKHTDQMTDIPDHLRQVDGTMDST